jgi:dienelactone hydrolase
MKRTLLLFVPMGLASSLLAVDAKNPKPAAPPPPGDQMLADYFRAETAELAARCLADIKTLDDWKSRREEYRRQLQEMLGLWPMPERTDLKPVITGRIEQDEFTVEKLHFQASPHLYVTANLYLPKKPTPGASAEGNQPAPAILYVCGHSKMTTNGLSLGNKTGYQHHGAWFARNGYVCLVIDSLQLGEIEGLHHGTYREGMWWWNSRGYTPAGVEAWFGIRALDYLCSRPEVDKERIGMTGRSGGGSYTWTVAALDDRVKVACPVAGITDLQNQVVDGCVEGHCDCMFFLNSYRWDFAQVAALLAPRPLLIANSDKDRIFPLDGVMRLHGQVRGIYQLYGATDKLGLLITEGPHEDTQDLQVPVFRWFNRFLKGEKPLIEMAAKKLVEPAQLRVFDQLPADQVNTNIQSLFVPRGKSLTADQVRQQRETLIATLREKTFGGWPAEGAPLDAKPAFSVAHEGVKFSAWDFLSQHDMRLRLYVLESAEANSAGAVALHVLDPWSWTAWLGGVRSAFDDQLKEELQGATNAPALDPGTFEKWKAEMSRQHVALAFFAPRGVGLTAWSGGDKRLAQIRRRFMLLGQTLDGMRVWDIRRAVQMTHFVREADPAKVELRAAGAMASDATLAALFEPGVRQLAVETWREPEDGGGDYLNLQRFFDTRSLNELCAQRAKKVE